VHGAQDSSSFIFLHEHSKVFKIIYTNYPGNVCPGKWLSGKHLVREIIEGTQLSGKRLVRESGCPGNIFFGNRLVRETSVRERDWLGNVRYPALRPGACTGWQMFRPQHILRMHMRLAVKTRKTKRRMEYKLMASPEYSLTFGIDGTRKSFGRARIDSSSWRMIRCFSDTDRNVDRSPVIHKTSNIKKVQANLQYWVVWCRVAMLSCHWYSKTYQALLQFNKHSFRTITKSV